MNDDYIYDAKWHPNNPSLFAAIDGVGNLSLYDMNKDIECSLFSHSVAKNALNKLSWSQDGKRIAVGDAMGKAYVLNFDNNVTYLNIAK
jgi:dynein intermediate chain